jgi:hypothetical protein
MLLVLALPSALIGKAGGIHRATKENLRIFTNLFLPMSG